MLKKSEIVLIGGGGHCISAIDVIEQENKYRIKGIIDPQLIGRKVLSYPVIGGDEIVPSLVDDDVFFLITIGQIKSYVTRKKIAELLDGYNAKVATVVSPRAYVSKYAALGRGTIVLHDAFVNAGAIIGEHCIINTKADIEHGVTIHDFCHISTSSVVNGDVTVGSGTFIGSNAVIAQGLTIEADSIISAGVFIKK